MPCFSFLNCLPLKQQAAKQQTDATPIYTNRTLHPTEPLSPSAREEYPVESAPVPAPKCGEEEWARLLVPALERCLRNETSWEEQKSIKGQISELRTRAESAKLEAAKPRPKSAAKVFDLQRAKTTPLPAPTEGPTPSQLAGILGKAVAEPDSPVQSRSSAELQLPGLHRLHRDTKKGEPLRKVLVGEMATLEKTLEPEGMVDCHYGDCGVVQRRRRVMVEGA